MSESGVILIFISLSVLVGIAASTGWVAALIMKCYGFGLVGNIAVGIVGALISGLLVPKFLGIVLFYLGGVISNAFIGAWVGTAAGLIMRRQGGIAVIGGFIALVFIGATIFSLLSFDTAIVLFGVIGGWGIGQYIQYIKGPSRVGVIGTTIACAFTGAIIASLFWRQPAIGLLESDILVETVVSALIGGGLLLLVAVGLARPLLDN